MKTRLILLLCTAMAFATSQSSFAKTVKAKPEIIATIKSIRVSDDVIVPSEMFYQGRAETFAMSAAITAGDGRPPTSKERTSKEQIIEAMKSGQVDLRSLVRSEFIKELQSAGSMAVVQSDCV